MLAPICGLFLQQLWMEEGLNRFLPSNVIWFATVYENRISFLLYVCTSPFLQEYLRLAYAFSCRSQMVFYLSYLFQWENTKSNWNSRRSSIYMHKATCHASSRLELSSLTIKPTDCLCKICQLPIFLFSSYRALHEVWSKGSTGFGREPISENIFLSIWCERASVWCCKL